MILRCVHTNDTNELLSHSALHQRVTRTIVAPWRRRRFDAAWRHISNSNDCRKLAHCSANQTLNRIRVFITVQARVRLYMTPVRTVKNIDCYTGHGPHLNAVKSCVLCWPRVGRVPEKALYVICRSDQEGLHSPSLPLHIYIYTVSSVDSIMYEL